MKSSKQQIRYNTILPQFYFEEENDDGGGVLVENDDDDEEEESRTLIKENNVDGYNIQSTPIFTKVPKSSILLFSNDGRPALKRSRGRKLSIYHLLWVLLIIACVVYFVLAKVVQRTKIQQIPETRY